MIWLGTCPHEPAVAAMLDAHEIGLMSQPTTHPAKTGWIWAADNGCFTTSATWRDSKWMSWLEKPHPISGCLFAVVPDVVGDHEATMDRFRRYANRVRELRYPVAFVAQDGATVKTIPWSDLDCLFIGGTTDFKQGLVAERLANEARVRDKWVHVGRINSLKRLMHWNGVADSSDGTHLTYGPKKKADEVARWVRALRQTQQIPISAPIV